MVLFFRYKEASAKTQRHTKSALQTAQLWPKASPFLTRQAQAKQRLSAKWKSALPFLDLNDDIRRGDTDTSYTKIYARREKGGQDNIQYIMGRIFCHGRLLRIAFMHRLIFCCKFIAVPKFSPVGGRILPNGNLNGKHLVLSNFRFRLPDSCTQTQPQWAVSLLYGVAIPKKAACAFIRIPESVSVTQGMNDEN